MSVAVPQRRGGGNGQRKGAGYFFYRGNQKKAQSCRVVFCESDTTR